MSVCFSRARRPLNATSAPQIASPGPSWAHTSQQSNPARKHTLTTPVLLSLSFPKLTATERQIGKEGGKPIFYQFKF